MKRNLISIIILGLTVINIIISSVTLFSVITTNQKTGKIVGQVASIINVDISEGGATEDAAASVPIENIATYSISDSMTLELKPDADGSSHYAVVSAFFSMDTTHKDYKKYGATVANNEMIFKSIIRDEFAKYTIDDARVNQDEIRASILKEVQNKYSGSDFIFDVSFSDVVFQ